MAELIIIRGNSGSGKSTLAKEIHRPFRGRALLIPQDTVRREMLGARVSGFISPPTPIGRTSRWKRRSKRKKTFVSALKNAKCA